MIPDIVEIKRLCASGQWFARIEKGKILLHDTVAGETVCIGQMDAEPVKRGNWILRAVTPRATIVDENVTCRLCGRSFHRIKGTWFKYCPECGAKMDGGWKHDEA